ncbi:MAG: hypothetical protein KN64_10625 [Sulfurovum sp. AS07-7]|jgi:hypothetical protein|nr:MAG: hypothetical protein KN64_10625 [Sulfurovum sp. AS07-7]
MSGTKIAVNAKTSKPNSAGQKVVISCFDINSKDSIKRKNARKKALIDTTSNKCLFDVIDNRKKILVNNKPFVELHNKNTVLKYSKDIESIATGYGISPRLVKAIMYMEQTHGWYDIVLDLAGKNKSILPMNINIDYWGEFVGTREQLHDPIFNITQGVKMLYLLKIHLGNKYNIANIATLYNDHNAVIVSEYGARVEYIYAKELWLIVDSLNLEFKPFGYP